MIRLPRPLAAPTVAAPGFLLYRVDRDLEHPQRDEREDGAEAHHDQEELRIAVSPQAFLVGTPGASRPEQKDPGPYRDEEQEHAAAAPRFPHHAQEPAAEGGPLAGDPQCRTRRRVEPRALSRLLYGSGGRSGESDSAPVRGSTAVNPCRDLFRFRGFDRLRLADGENALAAAHDDHAVDDRRRG